MRSSTRDRTTRAGGRCLTRSGSTTPMSSSGSMSTTICGTDLHILKGDVPEVDPGRILGHEAVGTVDAVGLGREERHPVTECWSRASPRAGPAGSAVQARLGQCLGGGGWILGHLIDGTQAEKVRVPYADTSTYLVRPECRDKEFLMLADIVPTAYKVGVQNGRVHPGDAVAIVGAGRSAWPRSRSLASSAPVTSSPSTWRNPGSRRPSGSGPSHGQQRPQDATCRRPGADRRPGCRRGDRGRRRTRQHSSCARQLVRPGGHVANIGVHGEPATLHLETLWIRDVTITTGLVDTYSTPTLLSISSPPASSTRARFVTHHFALDQMMEAYDTFSRRGDRSTQGRHHPHSVGSSPFGDGPAGEESQLHVLEMGIEIVIGVGDALLLRCSWCLLTPITISIPISAERGAGSPRRRDHRRRVKEPTECG